jgi:hypothetical protein
LSVTTNKNQKNGLDANAYLSRILFAQKMYKKCHKRRQDQTTNFCSGANMDAPFTALEALTNPALEDAGFVGFYHSLIFKKDGTLQTHNLLEKKVVRRDWSF